MEEKENVVLNALKAIGFLAGMFVLFFIGGIIIRPKSNEPDSGMYIRQHHLGANAVLSEEENTIDVLILGDSDGYSSFIPLELWHTSGITSFNSSTSSQRLYQTIEFLRKGTKYQEPKLVILETGCFFRRCAPGQVVYGLLENFELVKHHDRWKQLSGADLTTKVDYSYHDVDKGFVIRTEIVQGEMKDDYMDDKGISKNISLTNQAYIWLIQQYCDWNGYEIMLLTAPTVKSWDRAKHEATVKLSEQKGWKYLDLNVEEDVPTELQIDWQHDSRDGGMHLNTYGALKATTRLNQFLDAEYTLPDHRSDEAYVSWEELYQAYQKRITKELTE